MQSASTSEGFKPIKKLLKKIIFTPAERKVLGLVTGRYPVEKRCKDIQKVIVEVMDNFELRDELYKKLLKTLKGKKGLGLGESEEADWGWRVMCVFSRYLPPSRLVDVDLDTISSAGNQDVRTYIKRQLGIANASFPTVYAPSTQEIEWVAMKGPTTLSVFGISLQDMDPSLKTTVVEGKPPIPMIVVKLCEAILRWGGINTEGLFRIPASGVTVEKLRHSIEKGDYAELDQPNGDALAAASLLKFWLRTLPDPLVPISLYENVVNERNPRKALKELPEENQQVLLCLLSLMQTVISPSTQDGTRMSTTAMAIVMAPSILRSDTRAIADTPMTDQDLLKSVSAITKTEHDFLIRLIETIK